MKTSNFQFVNPYLSELNFIAKKNFNPEGNEIEVKSSFNVNVSKSNTEHKATVELAATIGDDKAPFVIYAKIASNFVWGDLNDETVDNFLKINAPAVLLSYLRPIIASVTNSSQFPVYNLPFINFMD